MEKKQIIKSIRNTIHRGVWGLLKSRLDSLNNLVIINEFVKKNEYYQPEHDRTLNKNSNLHKKMQRKKKTLVFANNLKPFNMKTSGKSKTGLSIIYSLFLSVIIISGGSRAFAQETRLLMQKSQDQVK